MHLTSSTESSGFAVKKMLVSSTYIIAKIVRVASVMDDVRVALIGIVDIILKRIMLIAIHIGPAAPFPWPLP